MSGLGGDPDSELAEPQRRIASPSQMGAPARPGLRAVRMSDDAHQVTRTIVAVVATVCLAFATFALRDIASESRKQTELEAEQVEVATDRACLEAVRQSSIESYNGMLRTTLILNERCP